MEIRLTACTFSSFRHSRCYRWNYDTQNERGSPISLPRPSPPDYCIPQSAKARLSELARRAGCKGPQDITVHGCAEMVVVSEEEFRRLKDDRTSQAFVDAVHVSPYRDIDIEPGRAACLCTTRCYEWVDARRQHPVRTAKAEI